MSNELVVQTRKELSKGGALCKEFNRVRYSDDLDWRTELAYAMELVDTNKKLQRCAKENPNSIGRSLVDLGVMGLTLSPAMRLAYLIPYGVNCTASPSYMGLEQVAYRTGMVVNIETRVVRENDEYEEWGDDKGTHVRWRKAKGTREDRGEVSGVFCVAQLVTGHSHTETMDLDDLKACRDAAAKKNGGEIPFTWTGPFKEEMYKKACLRRAWKHWPKVTSPQLVTMMEAVDRTDPLEFSPQDPSVVNTTGTFGPDQVNHLCDLMRDAGYPEAGWSRQLQGLARGMGYDSINSIPLDQLDEAASLMARGLAQWLSTRSESSVSAQDGTTQPQEAT